MIVGTICEKDSLDDEGNKDGFPLCKYGGRWRARYTAEYDTVQLYLGSVCFFFSLFVASQMLKVKYQASNETNGGRKLL